MYVCFFVSFLISLTTIPENQLYISQKKEVIDSVVLMIVTRRYFKHQIGNVAVSVLLNLAQQKRDSSVLF